MPPRLPRIITGSSRTVKFPITRRNQQTCPFCCYSQSLRCPTPSKRLQHLQNRIARRQQSTAISETTSNGVASITPDQARQELRKALADLQKHAASYVNISRLQLALRGLEQAPGQEIIRIAILGVADGGKSFQKAKLLLRLLVADPLKTEEEWERTLTTDEGGSKPLLLRIGHSAAEGIEQTNRLLKELNVSSPLLNGHKLEILVLEMDPPPSGATEAECSFDNAVLVPTMIIPTSNTGRYTQVTTPVHKSLIIGEGFLGAGSLLNYNLDRNSDIIGAAVNLRSIDADEKSRLPFQLINTTLGSVALESFRENINNAMIYEQEWFASGIPEIFDWVRSGSSATEGTMKAPLQNLINSLLSNVALAIHAEQTRRQDTAISTKVSSSELSSLRQGLSKWAERAHVELRDQLDVAFNGQRWRKLSWWKLFWRVDDVSMISSDILNQRFLINAEDEVIYLAGRIFQSGVFDDIPKKADKNWAYQAVEGPQFRLGQHAPPPSLKDVVDIPKDDSIRPIEPQPWPRQIPIARDWLATDHTPALQALAQKLVFQTLTTSTFSSAFAGLIYLSSVTTGLYEAGAVAALGIVFSLRRMQGKWETARRFWEDEVREVGRTALREAESSVGKVLVPKDKPIEGAEELKTAKEAVERAQVALAACK